MEIHLPLPHVPPLWRESRFGLEAASLLRSPTWRGAGLPRGEADPVLLIPGFMAGDNSLGLMTRWLREMGYRTKSAGMRANVGCSEAACQSIEARLEGLAEQYGQRVKIVGQSRGGVFGKALAVRRPDLVSGVVTLGSPVVSQLKVHPAVLAQIALVGTLGHARVPGLFTHRCLKGDCCSQFRDALEQPFPEDVGFVSIYSRTDGIVDWHSCLDPAAEQVEVRASHCGMSVNVGVYRHTARALARFRAEDAWSDAGVRYAEAA
jgi:pimeloyl-ACP methyl ester carboxylesterase